MTDHPRFAPVKRPPEKAHLDYNGGPLVDAVFRLIDRWKARATAKAHVGMEKPPCFAVRDSARSIRGR